MVTSLRLSRSVVVAAAVVLCAVLVTAGPAGAQARAAGKSAPAARVAGGLDAVAALSAKDAWAVGGRPAAHGATHTLAMHWNGSAWSAKTIPGCPGSPCFSAFLTGVAGAAADDVWAVGYTSLYQFGAKVRVLVLHWNGRSWARFAVAGISSAYDSQLRAVTVISRTDAWAVGDISNSKVNGLNNLILHWNGKAWKAVSGVPSYLDASQLYGVSAVSAGDVWAVGSSLNLSTGGQESEALHWDGGKWTGAQVDQPTRHDGLAGVAALSASNAWAVGSEVPASGHSQPLAMHWQGTHWSAVSNAGCPSTCSEDLAAVSASSPTRIWGAGHLIRPGEVTPDAIIEGSRGFGWSAPIYGHDGAMLTGIVALSASDAWAVGYTCDQTCTTALHPFIVHWNGTKWTAS